MRQGTTTTLLAGDVHELAQRLYYALCLTAGRLLRAARYSRVTLVDEDGERLVRKSRSFHAPLFVWLGGSLLRILDTGVRLLPQRQWEAREVLLYRSLHDTPIRVDADGSLVLPRLLGQTLAALLEDPARKEQDRTKAIERAAVALAKLHRQGITHGDAMAENVMVDLEAGAAHWFDFETSHEPDRTMAWRRADDVRALLTSCLLRTAPEKLAETLRLIVDACGTDDTTRLLATHFATTVRRPLVFHLGQAPLSFRYFRQTARLLRERVGEQTTT